MRLWHALRHGLRVLTRRSSADRDLDDEIAHFMEEAAADARARGTAPDAARRAAARIVGDPIRVREQVRDGGWEHSVSTWLSDLRLAARMLGRSPVFAVVVVAVIAIGSGAVTTVFSAMNALVLAPVPGVKAPAGLVGLRPARRDGSADEQVSYPLYRDVRAATRSLSDVVAWGRVALTISAGGPGVSVQGAMVTDSYFRALGIEPVAGRLFTPDDMRAPGMAPVLVVSERFWREQLGARADIAGAAVTVNGHPFTVVGAAAAPFRGVYTGMVVDAWVPVTMQPQLRPRSSLEGGSWTWMFGRLRPGVSAAEAEAELSTVVAVRAQQEGRARPDAFVRMRVEPLTGLPGGEGRVLLGFMAMLLGASGLVLLIAGVNVASMLSARYLARVREMAVRAALGAGRTRIVRHLLTEVAMLFALGAAAGYGLAIAATTALEHLPLPEHIPITLELSPDLRVFAFGLAVSLGSGLLFGLGPSLAAARRDITEGLRDHSPGRTARRGRAARVLVASQLACSLVLLVMAFLFLRALEAGGRIPVGFSREDVAIAWLEPESWGYDEAKARRFYDDLDARVRTIPGVEAVAAAGRVPLMMSSSVDRVATDGGGEVPVHSAVIGPEYFDVLELPMVRGRTFAAGDDPHAGRVAIVNETMARRLWPGSDGLGRTFRFRGEIRLVVGVARDAKYASLLEEPPAFAYFPVSQVWQPTQALMVRTAPGADPRPELQRAVLAIDPRLPPPRVTTLARATGIALLPQRAAGVVTAALGGVGLLLTVAGVYGVMAFSAGRRTREIGIRLALGATRSSVLRLLVGEGLRLSAAGLAVGLVLAAAATRLLSPWLFDVSPLDLAAFAATSAMLVASALVAAYLPARRAAEANPLDSLRVE